MLFAFIGMLGGLIAKLLGGWTSDMITLLIFMAIDFITGLLVAGVFKNSNKSDTGALNSKAGWKGLCKKCITLFFVIIAHRLDIELGISYIRTSAIVGFMANEAMSIVENAGLMGVPLPKIITRAIEVLKENAEGDIKNEDNEF
ncbi:MAG: phage holin family protein [Oscillospiraceae bacterium]|nr:phage holin family protein [Oscillospiraceae bacterium]